MLSENQLRPLFPSFEPQLLEAITQSGTLRNISDKTILVKAGQYIRSTMLVLSGLVKVYREDDEGNEFFMYYIKPGEACALSMICSAKTGESEVTAKTVGDAEVVSIPLERMDEWMTHYKTWYKFVLGTYRGRFEELLATIDQVAFRNMDERLMFYLQKNMETRKSNILPVTHAEIASELNSSREVISRLMKKLADRGIVRLNRNSIEIIDSKQFSV